MENHCRYREADGMCAVKRQTDPSVDRPICIDQRLTKDMCPVAIAFLARVHPWDPIEMGFFPPMGEID